MNTDPAGAQNARNCNAITLELIMGAISMALAEMATLLERTAMSPFIREKKDFHVALADAAGRVIGATGGSTGEFTSVIFEHYAPQEMSPGDVYWYNDCYGSKGIVSHSPDQVFVAPVYFDSVLVGFAQGWAHFNDIGGMHPGTISPDATSIFQEGIIVPVVRLYHKGTCNDDLQRMFERNSRYPQMVRGDIRATVAAVHLGERRLQEMFTRFGSATVLAAFDQSFERSRVLLKSKLHELFAPGTYSFSEEVASDGRGGGPFRISMDLTVEPERVALDTSRTSDQAAGPINYLMHSGTPAAILSRYLLSLVPQAQANHGAQALIDEVTLREGSLLQPKSPAPLGMRGITAIRSMNCMLGILNQATGGMGGAANCAYVIYNLRGMHAGKPFLLSDGVAVGYGARPFADGIDAVYLVGQKNYPAEFMETVYPVRVRAYGLLMDSGGPGKWRGGSGVFREIEILADQAMLSVRLDGVGNPPWGVAGGLPGRGGRALVNPGTPEEKIVPSLSDGTMLKKGDIFRIETVGGGGWGSALEREPERVRVDVLGRFISRESALSEFGVVLVGEDAALDLEKTRELRSRLARSPDAIPTKADMS
jgi:N-methylhydantoinase B